jgi:uncharacterized membrane protein
LAVAGLTLQDGKFGQALGALLLFATNVAAIIFTATMVLLHYRVRETAGSNGYVIGTLRGWSLAVVVGTVIVVAIPLAYGSQKVVRESYLTHSTAPLAEQWAQTNGWKIMSLKVQQDQLVITAFGPSPELSPEKLRESLDGSGFADLDLEVQLIVGGSRMLPGKD